MPRLIQVVFALLTQAPSANPWARLAAIPDSLTVPPAPRPQPRAAGVNRTWQDSSRGIGYLTPVQSADAFTWLRDVILPLYRAPGGAPFAWLARGWIYRAGEGWTPYTIGGWIGVVYDGPVALVVYEARGDGWFRFRYSAPAIKDDGIAWAHASQLGLGVNALRLVSWESHYLQAGRRTFFADSARHALYATPDTASDVVAWLSLKPKGEHGAYALSALEVRGEWMRVRVQWPYPVCGKAVERTAEGWIRWLTPRRGSRLGGYMIC
jgi:hypothetical protein